MSFDKLKSYPSQKALNVVKTTDLYYTEFFGNTADPTLTKGLLKSSPNLYKEGSTFFLDYSHVSNSSDLKFLKRFFSKVSIGNTFSISSAIYYDEVTQTKYNFEGVYQLSGVNAFYNTLINLTGVSYSSSITDGNYYNYNFKNSINFSSSKGITSNYFASKLNSESPFNLEFFGIYGGDFNSEEYLEVVGATLNTGRYLIDNFIKLTDGQEIILINSSNVITNEKLYFKQSTVNLLMRGIPDANTISQSKYQNGIVKKIDSEQKTLDIFTNQNLHQRFCREIADEDNYYDWYAVRETENFKNLLNPYAYDKLSISYGNLSSVKITTVTRQNTLISDLNLANRLDTTSALLVDGTITSSKNYRINNNLISSSNIKIDLSDSSLINFKINPFYDEACSIPLNDFYYLNGIPGYDGASFIFLSRQNSPKSFYLRFEKDIVLKLNLII